MTLNYFTPADCAEITRKPGDSVRLTCRVSIGGSIVLTRGAAGMLGVKAGDKVAFGQDTQYPSDWYVSKRPDGFTLKPCGRHGGLRVTSAGLAQKMLGTCPGFSPDFTGVVYPVKVAAPGLALCANGARRYSHGGKSGGKSGSKSK